MLSAKPILEDYRTGKTDFGTLVDRLAAFPWKQATPAPEGDDPAALGEEGTFEEVDAAHDDGWLTEAELDAIYEALDARAPKAAKKRMTLVDTKGKTSDQVADELLESLGLTET